MYTPEERDALRTELLAAARADPRISGGAITGSASVGLEDRWSDIDLAFGLRDAAEMRSALADWTALMYEKHGAVDHCDVIAGAWVYRVFLLRSTLQVDIAFVPAAEFGARAPSFRLVFGAAADRPHVPPPSAKQLIGMGWLHALHARSCLARKKLWQAEYMISGVRDHALALACLRLGLPAVQGRGMDGLPNDVTTPLEDALVRHLDTNELARAFRVALAGLLREVQRVDEDLAERLRGVLAELAA